MQPYMNHGQVFVGPAHGHGHGGLGFVLLIVFLIVFAALVGFAAARFASGRNAVPAVARAGDEPVALLRLRYARGEIDREAFLQASADLGGLPPPAAA